MLLKDTSYTVFLNAEMADKRNDLRNTIALLIKGETTNINFLYLEDESTVLDEILEQISE